MLRLDHRLGREPNQNLDLKGKQQKKPHIARGIGISFNGITIVSQLFFLFFSFNRLFAQNSVLEGPFDS